MCRVRHERRFDATGLPAVRLHKIPHHHARPILLRVREGQQRRQTLSRARIRQAGYQTRAVFHSLFRRRGRVGYPLISPAGNKPELRLPDPFPAATADVCPLPAFSAAGTRSTRRKWFPFIPPLTSQSGNSVRWNFARIAGIQSHPPDGRPVSIRWIWTLTMSPAESRSGDNAAVAAANDEPELSEGSRSNTDYDVPGARDEPRGLKSGAGAAVASAVLPARAEGEKRLRSATRNP